MASEKRPSHRPLKGSPLEVLSFHPRRHVGARRGNRDGAHPIMSESFLAAAAERTAEAESDLVELKRGTWATDRVG
jgi:hypothetical protein